MADSRMADARPVLPRRGGASRRRGGGRQRSCNWPFTAYQMDLAPIAALLDCPNVRGVCVGVEAAPTTGRAHLQGFLQLKDKRGWSYMKALLPPGTHFEVAMGTADQNIAYCKKAAVLAAAGAGGGGAAASGGPAAMPATFHSFGEFTSKGKGHCGLAELYEKVKQGASMEELRDCNFGLYCRYRNGLMDAVSAQRMELARTTDRGGIYVRYWWGDTGTGKTRKALEMAQALPGGCFMLRGSQLKWMNGYDFQRNLVIDEYNNDMVVQFMLGFLDRYALRLEIKGGHTYAFWDNVWITSNLTRTELHASAKPAHKLALERRIHEWRDFNVDPPVFAEDAPPVLSPVRRAAPNPEADAEAAAAIYSDDESDGVHVPDWSWPSGNDWRVAIVADPREARVTSAARRLARAMARRQNEEQSAIVLDTPAPRGIPTSPPALARRHCESEAYDGGTMPLTPF